MSQIEIDPNFAGSGRAWKRRRRLRMARRIGIGVAAVGVVAGLGLLGMSLFSGGDDDYVESGGEGDELTLVQSEDAAEGGIVLAAAAAEAFLDIRGAPMIITLPDGPALGARRVSLEHQIHPQRARIGDQLNVIEDALFDATQRVQLTLPSSSADLAAFQARRETAIVDTTPAATDEVVEAGAEVVFDDDEGSWGEVVGGDGGATQVSYVETVIENTTTDVLSLSASERTTLFRDEVVRLETEKDLKQVLTDQGLSEDEIARTLNYVARMAEDLSVPTETLTKLKVGGLVALRMELGRTGAQLLQMSIYAPDRYLASLAQPGPGRFETSADPWFTRNLLRRADIAVRNRGNQGEVKLKDAVYSTALRNGVSSELVGELMVMLSRVQDLDRIATEGDRMRLIMRDESAGVAPAGQILYVALEGPSANFECYVVRPNQRDAPFGCYDPKVGGSGGGVGGGLGGSNFLIPVAGTKTSSFGPRHHPILNKTVNHNGVDWAAPTGTPVKAVASGKISRANFSSSYGNIVYIDHPAGAHSRYAHLNAFAEGISLGSTVQAGQIIGYVGTTGRSTGPHLHFELHLNGRPVDPLALRSAAPSGGASGAVEALVNQIIRVESAGNARAKNSRSTATGLGQFIESTWLRMMRTYRPDLVASLNRAELLELRFDPALSRAMVTNLARENEAFLRSRGHAITPGRLYLAHFLGPSGANVALKANPSATVLEVMGAGVVNANPFLKGKNIKWMTDWSDRKMSRVGRGNTAIAVTNAPAAPAVTPAEVKRYKDGIGKLLETL
ncbi:peptidoglycan DD-metalloendopeptidase family protein [Tateyamaria sp. SN6-1]|uniref:peptidoglycan DD-metalloendopeptidase family protein n=1 Tax=Tateyamaria sp. SN6-1 TaxID=3092148 RepID=UPI0039F4814B